MASFEDVIDLEFRIIDEPWNKYILEDHVIIKQRLILTKLMYKEITKGQFDFRFSNQIVVAATNVKEYGEPTPKVSTQELRNHIIQESMRFEISYQEWNEYDFQVQEVGHFRLRILNSLTMAHKTSKFNNDGEPIYVTDYTQQIIILPPKPRS